MNTGLTIAWTIGGTLLAIGAFWIVAGRHEAESAWTFSGWVTVVFGVIELISTTIFVAGMSAGVMP